MALKVGTTDVRTFIHTDKGIWTSTGDTGLAAILDYVIEPGSACVFTDDSQLYKDANDDYFYCIGTVDTEVKKLVYDDEVLYVKVALSFNEAGGSTVSDKYVYFGETYGTLPTPTLSGSEFQGWFTAASGGTEVTSATTVTTTDITQTLYAQWSTPIPTTRIGIWQGKSSDFDALWRSKDLASIGSAYNGRNARIVLVYKSATTGTTYQGDVQLDRIRYGGVTFDFDLAEVWKRDNVAAVTSLGTYATRLLDANVTISSGATSQFWSRDPNTTGSSGTGSAISVYGGYCLYAETSSTALGDVFWAMSPVFEYNYSSTMDIIIAMEGNACGILAVYIVDEETTDFTPSLADPDEYYTVGEWVYKGTSGSTTDYTYSDYQNGICKFGTPTTSLAVLEAQRPGADELIGATGRINVYEEDIRPSIPVLCVTHYFEVEEV